MADETLNDTAWRKVFERSELLSQIKKHGYATIRSADLSQLGEYPARLMAKIDFIRNRPQVFKEYCLNILPRTRREYVIFKDKNNHCYFTFPKRRVFDTTRIYMSRQKGRKLETLQRDQCTSESDAVEFALASSLLSEFCGERLQRTKSGRYGSGTFNLCLPSSRKTIQIDRVQLEYDGIYESENFIVIVEAKMNDCPDFNIRQLYFPYLTLKQSMTKKILPIFMACQNGEFRLTQLAFPGEFGHVELVKQHYYFINEEGRHYALDQILTRIRPTEPEDVPFPQADKLDKVVDVFFAMSNGIIDKEHLSSEFGFDTRQADYYKNAVYYLGWIDKAKTITDDGRFVLQEPIRAKRIELILKCLMSRTVFRESFHLLKQRRFIENAVSTKELETIIQTYRDDVTGSTVNRRAGTVRQWLKWIVANCGSKE